MGRAIGCLVDSRGHFLKRRSGFFEPGCLLLGAARHIVGGRGNFLGAGIDGHGTFNNLLHNRLELVHGGVEVAPEIFEGGDKRPFNAVLEIVVCKAHQADANLCQVGDVACVFDDLHDMTIQIKDWVVGRLNPDFLAASANALEGGRDKFAFVQLRPEISVVRRLRKARLNKHAVMLANNVFKPIAQKA